MAVEYGNILERPQDLIPMLQRFWEQLVRWHRCSLLAYPM